MKSIEELGGELCNYCQNKDHKNNPSLTTINRWCDEAYENYKDEMEEGEE